MHNISLHAYKPLQITKALTAIVWGKHKEACMAIYKAVMSKSLEYASFIWLPLASSTSINKLKVMQNGAVLGTLTGCSEDTNLQHLHDETLTLPIHEHLHLYALQTKHPSHTTSNKSPFLKSYLHKVDANSDLSPLRPLCTTQSYFIFSNAPTYAPRCQP